MRSINLGVGRIRRLRGVVAAGVVLGAVGAAGAGLFGAGLAGASAAGGSGDSAVVVVLRNQLAATPDTRARVAGRTSPADDAQAPLVNAVLASGGTVTQQFHLLDAFAAT